MDNPSELGPMRGMPKSSIRGWVESSDLLEDRQTSYPHRLVIEVTEDEFQELTALYEKEAEYSDAVQRERSEDDYAPWVFEEERTYRDDCESHARYLRWAAGQVAAGDTAVWRILERLARTATDLLIESPDIPDLPRS